MNKELKAGDVESIVELSTALLSKYKTAAATSARNADAKADDEFSKFDIKNGEKSTKLANKRFSGIIKATKKQFANNESLDEFKDKLNEAHKLNDEVVMSYSSLKGVKGHIGEIRHGAYKGAPKTYTIDYQHPKHPEGVMSSIQLSSDQFKAHKPGKLGEEVESIDELSNNTLQSVAKKRADQSKTAGGVGINNPARAKAMSLLRKSNDAKYRHTEHPDKVTPPKPPVLMTPDQLAAHKKTQSDKADDLNNRGYGKGRYMGDSVEQEEVEDQLDEMGYGTARHADFDFADSGSAQKVTSKKFHLKTKAGRLVSTHSNALDAVRARDKIGDHNTHSIVKEMVEEVEDQLDENVKDDSAQMSGKTVDEGIGGTIKRGIKSVKRGVQGWGNQGMKNMTDKETPRDLVNRNKGYDDQKVKSLSKFRNAVDQEHPARAHSPQALQNRVLDREMKKRGLTSEEVKTEKPRHKVGDTVWATSPTNKALTMAGKVTKIGQTLTTVKHKDGSEGNYPHKLVNKEYSNLHTDPAKTYKQFQREHLEQTGELLTLTEVKYILENSDGGAGEIGQHAGVDGHAPENTGKIKKMMGNKASIDAIVKIIAKGTKPI
jgi:hypothetical protein